MHKWWLNAIRTILGQNDCTVHQKQAYYSDTEEAALSSATWVWFGRICPQNHLFYILCSNIV